MPSVRKRHDLYLKRGIVRAQCTELGLEDNYSQKFGNSITIIKFIFSFFFNFLLNGISIDKKIYNLSVSNFSAYLDGLTTKLLLFNRRKLFLKIYVHNILSYFLYIYKTPNFELKKRKMN